MSITGEIEMSRVRNLGIMAHIDAGKTTTTERILYYSGRTHRMGEVHDGDTEMDWMSQERERGITITSAATTCNWCGHRINIIDTPGHVDFTAEVERSLRILDGGLVIFSGVEMVESQSEAVWRQADRYHIPRIVLVNKLDRGESSFRGTIDMIEGRLNTAAVPLQLPYRDEDRRLVGMVDLLTQRLIVWDQTEKGRSYKFRPVPSSMRAEVEGYRDRALERVAEFDERVLEAYLEGMEIDPAAFHHGLRRGCIENALVPVFGGAALQNQGIQPVLDATIRYLPSPLDTPPVRGEGTDEVRQPTLDAPFSALAFKVVSDRYAGRLVFLRVYSGMVGQGDTVLNSSTGKRLRLSRIFLMHADQRTQLDSTHAGDIVAVVGTREISTGDTLCDPAAPILLEKIKFPEPVVSVSVEPRTEAEEEALLDGLAKLAHEDPTFHVRTDRTTNQTIISGMGELHLEVLVKKLNQEHGVSAIVGQPRVAYRETLCAPIEVEERFVRQTGGQGQYGHVILHFTPLKRGEGLRFTDAIKHDDIPKEYRSAVEQGIRETLTNGPLAGYPMVDIGAALIGGSYHPLDSSELAFRSATAAALHKAYMEGCFSLLEPIMEGEVTTPAEYLGEVMEDLSRRRGEIQELQTRGMVQNIFVAIPLAETFGYATRLRSLTQGRATYTLRVTGYAVVPGELEGEIVRSRGY
ncbi:MAG: elongation factor G [Candidatus Bipolaricaulota bacterium]|nr:elongation factor G [Candidatus Bipolaricaulota bacterium]